MEHTQRNPDWKETIQTERHLPLQLLKQIIQLWLYGNLRACSHEPRTVNYPGVMIAPGQRYLAFTWWFVVPGQRFPGSTSLPRGKFIVIWSLRIYLNSFSFYTNCYSEWILSMFAYFWCFMELFIEKFILNVNNEHTQDYSCPGATFAFCSHEEKLPRQGGLPGVVSYRRQTMRRGKVEPGVSELPPRNELSRDHVNRPQM